MFKLFKGKFIYDAIIIAVVTLLAYLGLSALHLEHYLLFLFPVPIALFTIKYEDSIAILPLSIIVVASAFILMPLPRHNAMMEGFVIMTITGIIGVLHGYIAERHMPHILKMSLIIVADIIANFMILVIFSPSIFGYTINHEVSVVVEEVFELLHFLSLSEGFKELTSYLFVSIIPMLVIMMGILEAILTHVVVHVLAKRVFKIEYGHTFTGIGIYLPRLVTLIFLPVLIITLIFIPQFAALEGVASIFLIIGMNIVGIGFIFYLLEGYTILIRYFACNYHKRAYLLTTVLMIFLSPLMFLLGMVDSVFRLQPKIKMKFKCRY